MKLSNFFKQQTVYLCDSANFSEFSGFIDETLINKMVPFLELPKKI